MEPLSVAILPADAEIEQVSASAQFRKAPAQRELLRYLWMHRHEPISEYTIGVEALARKSDFDPRFDSSVRVQISRLRQRLKDHYDGEGRDRPMRVSIPLGEYRVEVASVPVTAPAPITLPPARKSSSLILYSLCGLALMLAADDLRLRFRSAPARPPLPSFWAGVAQSGQPTPIIVPAPIFFRWENHPYVVRDFGANHFTQFEDSPFLAPLAKQFGRPQISQLYTVASDTRAASTLAKYLQDRAVPAEVIDTPTATIDVLGSHSTIIFAGPGTTGQLGTLLDKMNFYLIPGKSGVLNRRPESGEPAQFSEIRHAPLRSTNHGIIARLPGKASGTVCVVFLSTYNPALLSMTLSPVELDQLTQFLRRRGDARFFETVIRFERNADRILQAAPVAYRDLKY